MNEFTYKLLAWVGIFVLVSGGMWLLWNWVMPELGLPQLGYLKFVGLTVLLYTILPGGAASKIVARK